MQGHAEEHEWEYSPWPLVLSLGVLFLAPFSFSLYFVYDKPLAAIVTVGIGVPLILISIIGWVKEANNPAHSHSHPHDFLEEHDVGDGMTAMPFFILAEAFIFAAFFAAYWVSRLKAPFWPPDGTPHMSAIVPIIMTVILVASSVTFHVAEDKLVHKNNRGGFIFWTVITMILGATFLGFTINEWNVLFGEGFNFKTNIFSTTFFSITGFHGSHVIVGLGMFACALFPVLAGGTGNKTFVRAAGLYWHFVDIVWFFVFSQLYFW